MKVKHIIQALSILALGPNCGAFAPNSAISIQPSKILDQTQSVSSLVLNRSENLSATRTISSGGSSNRGLHILQAQSAGSDGDNDGILSNINPLYAAPYLIFLGFAVFCSSTEPLNASNDIIAQYIADPLNPNLGSSLFEVVFNTLGLIPLPMAMLLMPGTGASNNQKFSATPFLFGSAAAGYGSLGLYLMTRKPVTNVNVNELGWFTKNILENKIFNWIIVAALANTYLISGAGEALLTDAKGTFDAFFNFISESALGTVSTIDLSIICLAGASLVPEDLERRGFNMEEDKGKAYAIAASTLLVPALGLATYAALRPSLDEEK